MCPGTRSVWTLLCSVSLVLGQHVERDQVSHGMDMDMDMGMSLAEGQMIPYLHFQRGDILWFQGWVPQSKGALVGTCIGLFLLALFDRWLAAMRAVADAHWTKRAQIRLANRLNANPAEAKGKRDQKLFGILTMRTIPPFIPAHDIARGLLHGAQSLLNFAFMLAAMTFNAGIIIAIVVGLGVGEMFFGRYASSHLR